MSNLVNFETSTLFNGRSQTTTGNGLLGPLIEDNMGLPNSLNYATSAVVGPVLCFLGMVGNVLSITVWTRSRMRGSTAIYLTGQAVADMGVLVTFLACDSVQAWLPDIRYSYTYGVFFSYLGYPFMYITALQSVWITVGVTVDRYIMVCWVTKAKSICSEKHTKLVLAFTSLCVVIINIPNFTFYAPASDGAGGGGAATPDNGTGGESARDATTRGPETRPMMSFGLSEFGRSTGGDFFEFWIHCMIVLLIPWVVVFTLNMLIIKKLVLVNEAMKDKKTAAASEKSRRSENQITRLLLTVTFVFLFFLGLQCITQCVRMQKPPEADWPLVMSTFAFGKIGIVFTSSLNFLFYCMTGRRFRKELVRILCGVRGNSEMTSSLQKLTTSSASSMTTHTSGI